MEVGAQVFNRRRWPRARLTLPAQVTRLEPGGARMLSAQVVDISPGGVYLTTGKEDHSAPGEMVIVAVAIPWEARRQFPFSRIEGRGRVVRVDEGSTAGMGVSFCDDHLTLLGSVMTPA